MRWDSLISRSNLELAWRRINTASNHQHKRFFREAYLVYESTLDDQLRRLRAALQARSWEPSHPVRIYLPKPSGLQRPITLLAIEDQVVLQAVANVFASQVRSHRQQVELKTVFSNILAGPPDSIFFTERWQATYGRFQEACKGAFEDGYTWVADFDLAAYYDTISHDLLIANAFPRNHTSDGAAFVRKCLAKWSADNLRAMTEHGIPQGPLASDFLAEAFFLPIDQELMSRGYRYVRYVDDIRLFGKSKNEVTKIAIELEQECRHRGLIPQSAKFGIREARSAEDAMGALPSISPTDSTGGTDEAMTARYALQQLNTAIDGRPLRIIDKSRFKYVMYRAPPDTRILDRALLLLPRHFEQIDTFAAYFGRFNKRPRIARVALEVLQNGVPYTYVRGELWHVAARLGGADELRHGLALAQEDARRRSECVALSWGVMHFLLKCDEAGIAMIRNRLTSESPLSRSLLGPVLPDRMLTSTGQIVQMLKSDHQMEHFAAARELQRRQVGLGALGIVRADLPDSCQDALQALGVIQRRRRAGEPDFVAQKLVTLYGSRGDPIWRQLLSAEYEHALQIIIEAQARFTGAYSYWLALQDSFNDAMVRKFIDFLTSRGLPGHQRTVASSGSLVKYGALIQPNSPFDQGDCTLSQVAVRTWRR